MKISQNKYIQMIFELNQFGSHNNYKQLVRPNDSSSSWMHRLFYKIYIVFGMIIRPLFIDFVGPTIPFISSFWLDIKDSADKECGKVDSE